MEMHFIRNRPESSTLILPLKKYIHMKKHILILLITLSITPAIAQEKETENTLKLTAITQRSKAHIEDMNWLAGHWTGPALGGISEELWTPPMAGAMMGSYRLVKDDKIIFHEILTLHEEEESLTLKLKHFNEDLTGWEEKNEVREFKLISMDGDKAYFEGMTFVKTGDKTLRVYLAIQQKDGSVIEEVFEYTKKNELK